MAVADAAGTVATPLEVLDGRDRAAAHRRLRDLVDEYEAGAIVIGLPVSLDGEERQAARAARTEAGRIAKMVGVPVELHDERLTTVTAERGVAEMDVRGPARRRVVDKLAAAVMLQSWLDGHRSGADVDAAHADDDRRRTGARRDARSRA